MKLSEVLEVVPGLAKVKVSIRICGFIFWARDCCDRFKESEFADMKVVQMFVNDGWLEIGLAPNTEEMSI